MSLPITIRCFVILLTPVIVASQFIESVEAQTHTQIVNALLSKIHHNDEFLPPMRLKDVIKVFQETIAAKTRVKFDIVIHDAAFKAIYPEFEDIRETEMQFPKLRNVQFRTLLNIALSQCHMSTTFCIYKNRVIIFPGNIPPPLIQHPFDPMYAVLLKRISWPNASKMKAGEALEFVGVKGDFTIMLSVRSWLVLNPESLRVTNQNVTVPKVESATCWQFIQHISRQIGGVPIVMADHVFIVAQHYPLSLSWP